MGVQPIPGVAQRISVVGGNGGDAGGGHGTGGVLLMDGLWPYASVDAVKVGRRGRGSFRIADGILTCLTDPAVVAISMPIGVQIPPAVRPMLSLVLWQTLAIARYRGVRVFAASGNHDGPVAYPASYPLVTAIGGYVGGHIGCPASVSPGRGPAVVLVAPMCNLPLPIPTFIVDGIPAGVSGTSYTTSTVALTYAALRSYGQTDAGAWKAMTQTARPTPDGPLLDIDRAFLAAGLGGVLGPDQPTHAPDPSRPSPPFVHRGPANDPGARPLSVKRASTLRIDYRWQRLQQRGRFDLCMRGQVPGANFDVEVGGALVTGSRFVSIRLSHRPSLISSRLRVADLTSPWIDARLQWRRTPLRSPRATSLCAATSSGGHARR